MPKATAEARQQNAHERALATVAAMQDTVVEESDEPSDDQEELPLPNVVPDKFLKWDPNGGEDFFTYLAGINPEEQRNITLKISSVNQDGSTGGLLKNITGGWDKIDENWLRDQLGVGKYKVELKTPPKSGRRNDWTRVQIGSDDEIKAELRKKQTFKEGATSDEANQAVDVVASAAEKGMGFLGKSYEKALEVRQNGSDPMIMAKALAEMGNKGPDTGALLAGLASIISAMAPKKDENGDKLLFTMLENQRKDAERRADEAEKRAIEDRRRDREDADRREKDRKDEMERREREYKDRQDRDNKFWELMLKEKEKKSDEFGLTDLLKGIVVPLVKERIEGGGSPEGWAGVVGNLIEQVPNAVAGVSAIMAARNGATPQQVQQIQAQANPQQAQQQEIPHFYKLIIRLNEYFADRDPQLYDGNYIIEMLEQEYAGIHADIFKQEKGVVLNAIAAFDPPGKAIMERPQSAEFMSKVIDAIKFPDTMDDIFGEPEPDDEKEPIILHGKARKINGRAKANA